jgi:DNA-binding MarR family transcriptional regulator
MLEIASHDSSADASLLMDRSRHLMLNARQKEMAPYHISPQQAYLLSILYRIGHKATLLELSRYINIRIATLSVEIIKMEKDGLVKKTRETPKSTLLIIELTPKGIQTYKNTNKLKSDKAIMSILTEEERQQLISILNKIILKAETYRPRIFIRN